MRHKIKFYPVGNGDQTLIRLKDLTTIVIDCNIRQGDKDSNGKKIYDAKSDLLKSIATREGNPFVDVFVLTHGDQDHCRGFRNNFYLGDPTKYGKKNKENNEIIIDEMWFSPMIAEQHTNDDENAYQTEAERRIEMHLNNHKQKDLAGNRIKIVGYDGSKDYSTIDHLRVIPGTIVTKFNEKEKTDFSFFIHSPFKEQLTDEEKDKNYTSIVFQARFKNNSTDTDFACLAMFSGDADHYAWNLILEKTKKYNNQIKNKALSWDILLAPHHCSWTFFNDTPQEENTEPKKSSLELLDYKRSGGIIIASSKKIINNTDNPPHYEAKQEYLKKLAKSTDFLNTSIEPNEDEPEPIEFEISTYGITRLHTQKEQQQDKLASAAAIAATSIIKKPWCE